MFLAILCPSSGAYQLQQQPLLYCRNVVVAEMLVVVGPVTTGPTTAPDDGHKVARNMLSGI